MPSHVINGKQRGVALHFLDLDPIELKLSLQIITTLLEGAIELRLHETYKA
jgi:hypothetical protein